MKQMFRNSMFGFHKEDVANFISKQSKQYEKKLEEAEKEKAKALEEYEKIIEELTQEKEELERYRALRESDLACAGVIQILSKKIDSECAALAACLEQAESTVKSLEEVADDMKLKLSVAEILREKARRFDQLSSVLGGIVSRKEVSDSLDSASQIPDVSFVAPDLKKVDLSEISRLLEGLSGDFRELIRLVSEMVEEG